MYISARILRLLRAHAGAALLAAFFALSLCWPACLLAQSIPHHPTSINAALPAEASVSPEAVLADRICSFCHGHLGQTVGTGECTDLADKALAWAGGQRRPRNAQ